MKSKEILIKCLKYISMGILILVVIINISMGAIKAVTHDPVPKVFGFSELIVMSGSMEPTIYAGDIVIIKEQPVEKYKVGDIITYTVNQTAYTHRIIDEENGEFTLKGDNNNTADEFVKSDQFEGKVLFTVPKIGIAVVFFKRPEGMAVLIALLLILAYWDEIFRKLKKGFSKK